MLTKLQLQILIGIILGLWFQEFLKEVSATLHGGLAQQGFGKSISDANLMFEFLLGGVEIDQDNNIGLTDKEMASMRQGRAFLAYINDNAPKTLFAMEQMLSIHEDQIRSLTQPHFESLVLGMIYSAHQARRQENKEEQQAWASVLTRLANVTVNELRRQDPIKTST